MHVMIVTSCMAGGGAERVISHLLRSFVKQGTKCSLVLVNKTKRDYEIPEQVIVREIGKLSSNPLSDKLKRYAKVRSIARELSPDVVLSLPEEIGIYVILAMLGSGIPVVVSERNNPRVMPYKKITRALRRLAYPFAKGLVFQTEMARDYFPKHLHKKSVVLPNPLDISELPDAYKGERERTVVGAGRLNVQKNFPLLIDAFAIFHESHPDYKLIIYGEGECAEPLEEKARAALPEGSYAFPGRVKDLVQRMNKAAMFVLSSDYEGMPNVLIEAMATGVPSISTDCPSGGSAMLIKDGENGFLTPVGDAKALAEAMNRIADDKELSEAFSENGIKVRQLLEADKICGEWLKYLEGKKR